MQSTEAVPTPSNLSDEELVNEVRRLASVTRGTTAVLVAHLAELEARGLHLAAGYPSLFSYCTDLLRLSEHEAYHRIEAARLARRFPIVLEKLADGGLTLTTARLLSSQMTLENHQTLLAAAAGKSKREVEALLARMFPAPDVPSSIRKVPAPRSMTSEQGGVAGLSLLAAATVDAPAIEPIGVDDTKNRVADPAAALVVAGCSPVDGPLLTCPPPSTKPREVIRPLAADRYEIRFTASAATREKLQLASELLRHAIPDGNVAEIVDRALAALLEDLARKKFSATARPTSSRPGRPHGSSRHTRHIPARVKRAVWLRDGGCCAFVSKGGRERRCRERGFLEFHHVHPYAEGGEATIGNIELRCRAHNTYEADLFYGRQCGQASGREARKGAHAAPSNSVRTEFKRGPSLRT